MVRVSVLLVFFLLCGCKKTASHITAAQASPVPQQQTPERTGPPTPTIQACSLITNEEVGAVQTATITDAKSSAGWSGNLVISQCYYSSKEPNMSVSLALIEADGRSSTTADVTSFWTENFRQPSAEPDEEKQSRAERPKGGQKREENEKKTPPRKIEGVGGEAYWSGNRFGGALYVLKNNVIVRVSVGGPGDEQAKIEKSRALASKAISRF